MYPKMPLQAKVSIHVHCAVITGGLRTTWLESGLQPSNAKKFRKDVYEKQSGGNGGLHQRVKREGAEKGSMGGKKQWESEKDFVQVVGAELTFSEGYGG